MTETSRGRLSVNPGGYAFVTLPEGRGAVFVPPGRFDGALDGDEVAVSFWPSERGFEGRVQEVTTRRRTRLVGVLARLSRGRFALELDDPRVLGQVEVRGGVGDAEVGELVAAKIVGYPTRDEPGRIAVEVERSLGMPGDLEAEIARILVEQGIAEGFSAEVEDEAERAPTRVEPKDLAGRTDLRHMPFMTIDPEDARDFDDALCAQREEGSGPHAPIRLWVAVADVAHYVRPDSHIDAHAAEACFSTYLPHRAIPMLPEQLSSNMCSLVPHEDRLAMVVELDVDAEGSARTRQVHQAVIHSHARLAYPQVAEQVAGHGRLSPEVSARVDLLLEVAARLRRKRLAAGSIELSLPETRIVLDDDDRRRIRDVVRSRPDENIGRAYNLVEECMLAANVACARLARQAGLDVPYRVHDRPDPRKLANLARAAEEFGLPVEVESLETPKGVQALVDSLRADPALAPLNALVLRAMAQADYRAADKGHFALAFDTYLHFTSPIRRYPDLLAHRAIKAHLQDTAKGRTRSEAKREREHEALVVACARSSERERAAAQAERDTKSLFAASFMNDRIGDRFVGTITSVQTSGIWLTLDEPFVDVTLRRQRLFEATGEEWHDDESGIRLTGERSHKTLALGDRLVVEIENVSLARRVVEVGLIAKVRPTHTGAGRRRG